MFHVHLKKMGIMLLLGRVFCNNQIKLIASFVAGEETAVGSHTSSSVLQLLLNSLTRTDHMARTSSMGLGNMGEHKDITVAWFVS